MNYVISDIPSRGSQTFELLNHVMSKPNIVHIKGNHELFLQLYLEGDVNMWWNYERFGGYGGFYFKVV